MQKTKIGRAVWAEKNIVFLIDQLLLPHKFEIYKSETYKQTCIAIKTMITRGAGSIGATAGFAMFQAAYEAPQKSYLDFLKIAKAEIEATRPTARDLFFAVDRVYQKAKISVRDAEIEAHKVADEIVNAAHKIGKFGNTLIKKDFRLLTHCNAGSLAIVEYGSATAPMYEAHKNGKNIFVYVDETRPRNQGAKLTSWELNLAGIKNSIIADNAAAWYMSQNKIDMVIVGADRIVANGDTANKIGTLTKAILAKEFGIPFYVAAPFSTLDFNTKTGKDIIIEERDEDEVLFQTGINENGELTKIRIAPKESNALNPAFDVTPNEYITAFITEKGIIAPNNLISLK